MTTSTIPAEAVADRDRLGVSRDVIWLPRQEDGREWAAAWLHGGLVQRNAQGWYRLDAQGNHLNVTTDEFAQIRQSAPRGPGVLPIWPEQRALIWREDLFRRWSATELYDAPRTFDWLVRGCWADPTYGQIAGGMKTLKSHVASFKGVAVAAGLPLFGRFQVDRARPVVFYIGEGGRLPFCRRLDRIAAAMGVNWRDLPIEVVFDVAPVQSDVFRESLHRDLVELEPGLVILDPLYAYHGATTRASDLHAEGSLLAGLSAPCTEAGAGLAIVNHFNQTGDGDGLKRITQAGSGEWCDSWLLLTHRERPDVAAGRFQLTLDIGSRQWGGTTWDLNLDLGRFDPDLGLHVGDITWDLKTHDRDGGTDADKVLTAAQRSPWTLTREELAKEAGGNLSRMRTVIDQLTATGGPLTTRECSRTRSNGRSYPTTTYGPTSSTTPDRTEIGRS